MSSVLSLPVVALSVILTYWLSFEALLALMQACDAAWAFTFSMFLSFAFCSAFSLLSFNIFFFSIFISYTFVALSLLNFTDSYVFSFVSSSVFSVSLCSFLSFP